MTARPPFQRTVCACDLDRDNCQRPAHLLPGQYEEIAGLLRARDGVTSAEVRGLFRASKGAVVYVRATGQSIRIPTITPAVAGHGCVFLDRQGRCATHEVAPFGCAYFDVHMDRAEADRRSLWGLVQIAQEPSYQTLRATLQDRADDRG
jgi:hypothetical protein